METVRYALVTVGMVFAMPAFAQSSDGSTVGDIVDTITTTVTAGQKLAIAEETNPQTDSQGIALFDACFELSHAEYNEGAYKDSDEFAEPVMAAAEGQRFVPEAIMGRQLPVNELNDAANQRRRLVVTQSLGARDIVPIESAQA